MQFNLPGQLAIEVASYDKTAKELAKLQATAQAKPKKNTYSLGKPFNMFPSDIIKDSDWMEAVETINQKPAGEKVHLFTRPVFGEGVKPIAFVYYHKQLWVAGWLPRRKDDGYVYGLTFAYKDTAAARKQCTQGFINKRNTFSSYMFDQRGAEENMIPRIKDGRTYWYRKTVIFDKELFADEYTQGYWRNVTSNHQIRSYNKCFQIDRTLSEWQKELLNGIPTYSDSHSYFERLVPKNNTLEACMNSYHARPEWANINDEYIHDVDHIINNLKGWHRFESIKDVLEQKWFRAMVLNAMKETKEIHIKLSKEDSYCRRELKKPYATIMQFLKTISPIVYIYPDMDYNYLHSRYEWLSKTELPGLHSDTAIDWIRNNVPQQSFMNMLEMHYKHKVEEYESNKHYINVDSNTGNHHVYFNLWRDTYSMLTQCIAAERTDNIKPKRWRLIEWHDKLMAETWKIRNPKVDLPQKLLPEPIKINQTDDGSLNKYVFLQPIDTHQLAAWGQAVRNCVGSGSTYSEGIKKMKHLIVLCMINNTPRYTIQLTVDNGVMDVRQIADIGNRRLTDIERSNVQEAFQAALQIRESQLS